MISFIIEIILRPNDFLLVSPTGYMHCSIDKLLFLDVIIDDDVGEKGEEVETVPYQLSKEAMVMDMKVMDISVRTQGGGGLGRW